MPRSPGTRYGEVSVDLGLGVEQQALQTFIVTLVARWPRRLVMVAGLGGRVGDGTGLAPQQAHAAAVELFGNGAVAEACRTAAARSSAAARPCPPVRRSRCRSACGRPRPSRCRQWARPVRCSSRRRRSTRAAATTLPTTSASMSMKFCASLSTKYSSAMLRPPTTAITPSAMKSLLCMRWLSRADLRRRRREARRGNRCARSRTG